MDKTKLSSAVTVKQYRDFKNNQDRDAIADLIFERFSERYLDPFKNNPAKHGFSMMAAGCLMTESLYCFKKGRKKTGEAGDIAFENFFSESKALNVFSGNGKEFYENVRCGILHQGETYGGWKILRRGSLLDDLSRSINATKYLNAMELELKSFTDALRITPFNSKIWKGVIRKLDHICENCNA